MPLKIDKMFVFVSKEENGNEGILAFLSPSGWVPMVGADMQRVKILTPIADNIKKETGKDYEIRYFLPANKIQ